MRLRTGAALIAASFAAGAASAQVAVPPAAPVQAERTATELARTHRLAQCLVRDFRPQVVRILEERPGSPGERSRLDELRHRGLACAEAVTTIDREAQYLVAFDIAPVALRGALAEALYDKDFASTTRVRPRALARVPAVAEVATAPANPAEDPAMVRAFASCAVTNAPREAAALLRMAPGSQGEIDAVRGLVSQFDVCFPTDDSTQVNVPTVRGFLAEAVYRRSAAIARREPVEAPNRQLIARRASPNAGAAVIVPLPAAGTAAAASLSYGAEDVETLVDFSRCAARRRGDEAESVLALDYRQDEYDRAARALARRSWSCTPDRRLLFSRILFAGGLAEERLAAALNGGDLRARVAANAVHASSVAPRDTTEAIGICLVRSEPGAVAALLATAPTSAAESAVVRDLAGPVSACVPAGQVARMSQPSLRAVAAIAAYRLVGRPLPLRPAGNMQ